MHLTPEPLPPEPAAESSAPAPRGPGRIGAAIGGLLMLAALACIAAAAFWEAREMAKHPMASAMLVLGSEAPAPEDALPAKARLIPQENFPPSPILEELRKAPDTELAQFADRFQRERLVELPLEPAQWSGQLASGRLPAPGRAEAVGGVYTQLDFFEVEGQRFEVVGRLSPQVAALGVSYVMARGDDGRDGLFESEDAAEGWYAPAGFGDKPPAFGVGADGEIAAEPPEGFQLIGGSVPTAKPIAALTLIGLMLMALGGALVQLAFLQHLCARRRRWLGPLLPALDAMGRHPKTLAAVHCFHYGVLFGMMALAFAFPTAQMHLMETIKGVFTDGAMKSVGDAYQSGNVLWAALVTWQWNYFVATLLTAWVFSLFIPAFANFKFALSFAMIGFVMAPLSSGTALGMTYHSITLTLELQAYMYVCFAALLWPAWVYRAIVMEGTVKERRAVLAPFFSMALLAGVQLAVAGLYEAATLIAFR